MSQVRKQYFSFQEIGHIYGISESTVRRMSAVGELQVTRIGRRLLRVSRNELERVFGNPDG